MPYLTQPPLYIQVTTEVRLRQALPLTRSFNGHVFQVAHSELPAVVCGEQRLRIPFCADSVRVLYTAPCHEQRRTWPLSAGGASVPLQELRTIRRRVEQVVQGRDFSAGSL